MAVWQFGSLAVWRFFRHLKKALSVTHKPRRDRSKPGIYSGEPHTEYLPLIPPEYGDTHQNIELKHGWAGLVQAEESPGNPLWWKVFVFCLPPDHCCAVTGRDDEIK